MQRDNLKKIIALIAFVFVILPIILIFTLNKDTSGFEALGAAILLGIVIFIIAPIVLFGSLILVGVKRQRTKTKIVGFVGLGIMALIGIIISISTMLRNYYEDNREDEAAKTLVEKASPIYAPSLSYIEKDHGTKKPLLNGVLYKNDAYDFELTKTPNTLGHSYPGYEFNLRVFPNKPSNKAHFDPDNDMCNLEWFFPKDDEVNTGYRCIKIGQLKNGSGVYTNEYSQRDDTNWQHEAYFGILYQGKIIIMEIDKLWLAKSHRAIDDPTNNRIPYIKNILDSMSAYQKTDVEKAFKVNPFVGVTK